MSEQDPQVYQTLRGFVSNQPIKVSRSGPKNIFWPVSDEDIIAAENRMGFSFPIQLRQFYRSVGYGKIKVNAAGDQVTENISMVLPPGEAAAGYLREGGMIEVMPELWHEDELPFFNFSDSDCLVMRPHSATPEAVFWPGLEEQVAPDFVTFLERLYEDVEFFLDEEDEDAS